MILISSPNAPARQELQSLHGGTQTKGRALFLDRDGVLNHDLGYVGTKDEFHFIPATINLIRWARQHRYEVILVTNQSGIGRGYFSEKQFATLMSWVDRELQSFAAPIGACYYSPVAPQSLAPDTATSFFARKPSPEMIIAAAEDFNLGLESCILVGDKVSDVRAGYQAGIPTSILLDKPDKLNFLMEDVDSIGSAKDAEQVYEFIVAMHICDHMCRSSLTPSTTG